MTFKTVVLPEPFPPYNIVIGSIGSTGTDDYKHHKIKFFFDEIIEFNISAKYADEVNYGS